MAFEFTKEKSVIANNIWAYSSAAGAGLCFLVLLVVGVVSLHPKARAHLDRVSFRIVVYALFSNMILGIAMAVTALYTHPGFMCGFSMFITVFNLHFSSFLLFCIALNLLLVVVHGVNGRMMEKFYVSLTALLAAIIVVPPYASGQYGWNHLEHSCWYSKTERSERLIWQVTTQFAWTALTVLGEVVCASIVLAFMLRHNGRTRQIFVPFRSISDTTTTPQALHAHRYRYIIFRVALYPITSCLVNLLSVAATLHSSIANNISHQLDYNILLLSGFLYGGRTIIYALLAASDPALVRALQTLFSVVVHGTEGTTSSSAKGIHSELRFRHPTEVFVGLDTAKTVATSTAASSPEAQLESISSPPSDDKAEVDQYDQNQKPTEVDLAVDIELSKRSLDDRPQAVSFAEQRPVISDADLQRRERDIEAQQEQHDEEDAFQRQI